METLKHPGTILGAVDLVALVVGFVHFQKKFNDLKSDIDNLNTEDDDLKNKINKKIDENLKSIENMGKSLKIVYGNTASNYKKIDQLDRRIRKLEKCSRKTPLPTRSIVCSSDGESYEIKDIESDSCLSRIVLKNDDDEEEDEEEDEEDEIDYVKNLAIKNAKSKKR